ncbi:MAG: hypothetical protein HC860_22960 [Alkalinema sp. RU_4_3]|nr:hypothetical protein [Alkalinema sp. RU_4_3]
MSNEIPGHSIQSWLEESNAIDQYWDFDRLCQDLVKHKGKALTEYEAQLLKALLLGYNPQEIAGFLTSTDITVRVAISQKVLPWIELLVSAALHRPIEPTRERIPYWLERAGYRKAFMHRLPGYENDPSGQLEPSSSTIQKAVPATTQSSKSVARSGT